MIDRKISNKELAEKGLIVENVEILPPTSEECLAQLRLKRKIPYQKIYGKIYYQMSDLIKWADDKKIDAAS